MKINTIGTITGRFSCKRPNVAQEPKNKKDKGEK
jgi:hypothetical protein